MTEDVFDDAKKLVAGLPHYDGVTPLHLRRPIPLMGLGARYGVMDLPKQTQYGCVLGDGEANVSALVFMLSNGEWVAGESNCENFTSFAIFGKDLARTHFHKIERDGNRIGYQSDEWLLYREYQQIFIIRRTVGEVWKFHQSVFGDGKEEDLGSLIWPVHPRYAAMIAGTFAFCRMRLFPCDFD